MASSRHGSSRHSQRGSSSSRGESTPWQDRLGEACREWRISDPVFQIVSDRRGGRTAWSSRVTVNGQVVAARFWYDGKNLNNAKEDAAELALTRIFNGGSSSSNGRNGGAW